MQPDWAKQLKSKKDFRHKRSLPRGGPRESNICILREMDLFTSGPHPDGFGAWARPDICTRPVPDVCNCNVSGCLLGGKRSLIPLVDLAAVSSWLDARSENNVGDTEVLLRLH